MNKGQPIHPQKIHVTIDPGKVFITENPQQTSYANLTVTIRNEDTIPLHVQGVAIALPDNLYEPGSLATIQPVADETLWSLSSSGNNFQAFPSDPNVSFNTLLPSQQFTFTLQKITLGNTIGKAEVNTRIICGDGSVIYHTLPVMMDSSVSKIIFFKSIPSLISPGQSATLSWSCSGIDHCVIDPLGPRTFAASDSTEVNPNTTTIYTLTAYGAGIQLSAQWGLTVDNPATVLSLVNPHDNKTDFGNSVPLTWTSNRFVQSVSLTCDDPAITLPANLPVNMNQGQSLTVGPITRNTLFTLTAYGSHGQEATSLCEISVNPSRVTFNASPDNGIWQRDAVTIGWKAKSAGNLSISPAVPGATSPLPLEGNVVINPETDITYTLSYSAFENGSIQTLTHTISLEVMQVKINSFTKQHFWEHRFIAFAYDVQAQALSIDNGIGPFTPGQAISVDDSCGIDQSYHLTAGTHQHPSIVTVEAVRLPDVNR